MPAPLHFPRRFSPILKALTVICLTGILQATVARPMLDRRMLPLEIETIGGKARFSYRDSKPSRIVPIRPPEGAPNIVIVLLDDIGFGAAGTFGGLIKTPALDKLAVEGLRYNSFHTTSLCSPTRAALLTGRNHHDVGTGNIIELATSYNGYDSIIPESAATIAEVLKDNGYSTAAFGKWHNTPLWETTEAGPFDRWPTGLGFEDFYGFMAGETNQYFPSLYRGTTPVERPKGVRRYYLTKDLVNHAVKWINAQETLTPDKPFFVYFAPGATHAPHQVYREWWEPYRGKFKQGWDKLREQIFRRQKKLGVIPANAKLMPRPSAIPAWDSLSPARKKVAERLMEVYAGYLAQTDYQVGRLIDSIKQMGEWNNTLFLYMVGDYGAAAAGGIYGAFNEMRALNEVKENPAVELAKIDQFGGPKSGNEYPVGFAWAMDTPFQWTKQFASHLGGTRNPLVISWPKRIHDRGGLRSQFHHVVDIAPTIYEAAGIPAPTTVDGITQQPLDGVSMLYTFDHKHAKSRHTMQYFEIAGRRAIYRDGWWAGTYHNEIQWQYRPLPPFEKDRWELYNLDEDFTQAHDLANQRPKKLKALKALFLAEAARDQVFPLDDRGRMRIRDALPPSILGDRKHFTFREGDIRIPEDVVRATLDRSYAITARIDVLKHRDVRGVLTAAGGYMAGFSLYVKHGRPMFTYNYFGQHYTTLVSREKLATGPAIVRLEFVYNRGGAGKGGIAKLFIDDQQVGQAKLGATVPHAFTAEETLDIGEDTGTPSADYKNPFKFNGHIDTVRFDLK